MKGYMNIPECPDGSYYTGNPKNRELRLAQHQPGKGEKHTMKRLPVKLVYYEMKEQKNGKKRRNV